MSDQQQITHLIKRGIAFTLTTAALYIVCLVLLGNTLPKRLTKNLVHRRGAIGNTLTRLTEVKQTSNVDIVFLGSSHAYRSFDPDIFEANGYKTFNLGTSAQTPLQTQLLVDRYLDKLNPKIVVYEVYGDTFSIDGIESSLDIISNDDIDWQAVSLAFKQRNLKVLNTLLYSTIMNSLKISTTREIISGGGDEYVRGGYVRNNRHSKVPPQPTQTWTLKDDQFRTFGEIINKLQHKGIRVVLVQAPISTALYSKVTNTNEFDKRIKEYGDYSNFNRIINLNDSSDFFDSHHLNQSGVVKFNAALMPYLVDAN